MTIMMTKWLLDNCVNKVLAKNQLSATKNNFTFIPLFPNLCYPVTACDSDLSYALPFCFIQMHACMHGTQYEKDNT